ncbi:hypothetical protein F5890DRAFT_1554347 [Lentinula detonsa]|uniref:Uncharacterized protein n=1 Tax=Lentinula detonsa TaxID=2804962 RepID=A0AA38USG3_9AGAR|nr:hypothetical protein F5890DRAFT_1554347 [Lentinula detonsa]
MSISPSSTTTLSYLTEDNQNITTPALTRSQWPLALAPPYIANIHVPPPLLLSDTPLRERRGFVEFIPIIPRSAPDSPESVPMPAKGQLEPKAGTLPRRRRTSHTAFVPI